METEKKPQIKGIVIGKTILYDVPNKAYDLVSCLSCTQMFNDIVTENKIVICPNCKERIEIIKK